MREGFREERFPELERVLFVAKPFSGRWTVNSGQKEIGNWVKEPRLSAGGTPGLAQRKGEASCLLVTEPGPPATA